MTPKDAGDALLDFVKTRPGCLGSMDVVNDLFKFALYIRECEDGGIPVDRNRYPTIMCGSYTHETHSR